MAKKIVKTNVMVILLMFVGFAAYSMLANAGSLEPSSGPGPTMKTLEEVEPRIPIPGSNTPVGTFNIFSPGSYYLTGDRLASAAGIVVYINNVTIDLGGFSLIGNNSGTYDGIEISSFTTGVEIRNGTIRNFGGSGIDGSASGSEKQRVIGVRSVNNGSNGIYLFASEGCLVKDCTVSGNGESSANWINGIWVGVGSTVTGNNIHHNGYLASNIVEGIRAEAGCTLTGNIIHDNGESCSGPWVIGMFTGPGSTVIGNTSYRNGANASVSTSVTGIFLGSGNLVDQNTVYANGLGATIVTNMNLGIASCVYGDNVAP